MAETGDPKSKTTESNDKAASKEPPDGAIALLKADHRKVEGLFDRFEAAGEREKGDLARQICGELIIHTTIEEELFYPACRQAAPEDLLDEAQVEHDSAKMLIADLADGGGGDQYRDAKMSVLAEQIRHHVREEESADGVFALAIAHGVDTPELAQRLKQRKQALQQEEQGGRLRASRVVSINHQPQPQGRNSKENQMPRYDEDRDERGRFTSGGDDHRRGSRGRDHDDDRGGRSGWYGDSEGHSRAARGRDDERSYASRGEERSYARDRDDGNGRDRGQGGWFGDSRGHSEASRRGWENPRHGDSGWYGDSQGHSEASRRGWENSDHGRSGWYGDPQGHSEASRRGWDERGRGSSASSGSGGRYRDDDDDRRYARGRDEDDHRGRSPSGGRGRDEEDDRGRSSSGGRGRGGWFGDPEGHSQASRRGWEDR